ncbi:MAG: hypothetical protein AAFW84_01990 [Cyanobacteria bacterium J06635_15]
MNRSRQIPMFAVVSSAFLWGGITPLQARQISTNQAAGIAQARLLNAPSTAGMLRTQAIWLANQSTLYRIADAGHNHDQADSAMPGMEHPEGHSDSGHHHAPLEVPAGMPVPTLDLVVYEDPVEGWNLELQVSNFRFAPENVNGASSTDEGHAHLYVNGEKMGRIYGPWHHLPSLPPGDHEIMVELNANGHEPLVYQGQGISDIEQVIVADE